MLLAVRWGIRGGAGPPPCRLGDARANRALSASTRYELANARGTTACVGGNQCAGQNHAPGNASQAPAVGPRTIGPAYFLAPLDRRPRRRSPRGRSPGCLAARVATRRAPNRNLSRATRPI